MADIAIEMIAQGRVQGVGFRYFCQREAVKIGIKGYVENLVNGDVKILTEGEKELINKYIIAIRNNHPYASVVNLIQKEIPLSGKYRHFSIKI